MPTKWQLAYERKKYEGHRKRLQEAKSTIDKSKPPSMPMSMRREHERRRAQEEIEANNRQLLDRLADAMSRKNIDNEPRPTAPFMAHVGNQRQKRLQEIAYQNEIILHRLQETPPYYKSVEWERDSERHVGHLRNMTEFPHYFEKVVPLARQSLRSSNGGIRNNTMTGKFDESTCNDESVASSHLLSVPHTSTAPKKTPATRHECSLPNIRRPPAPAASF